MLVVRIQGGLGNQLFCYAAARRLAIVNQLELVIDDVTGFIRDKLYNRKFSLDNFNISSRKATPVERFEPFERYRRGIIKAWNLLRPFEKRAYITQEGCDFERRLLHLKITGKNYIDGLWQSESYFKDVEHIIRSDLQIKNPSDEANGEMLSKIQSKTSIAIHIRHFDLPNENEINNAPIDYYSRAVELIETAIPDAHFFVFSDRPEAARSRIPLPDHRITCVCHNSGDDQAFADLWLMSHCRHFIIANSTFSWWGAWLSKHEDKIIIAPGFKNKGKMSWGFSGLLPESWIKI